jgi:hypothetical protein
VPPTFGASSVFIEFSFAVAALEARSGIQYNSNIWLSQKLRLLPGTIAEFLVIVWVIKRFIEIVNSVPNMLLKEQPSLSQQMRLLPGTIAEFLVIVRVIKRFIEIVNSVTNMLLKEQPRCMRLLPGTMIQRSIESSTCEKHVRANPRSIRTWTSCCISKPN